MDREVDNHGIHHELQDALADANGTVATSAVTSISFAAALDALGDGDTSDDFDSELNDDHASSHGPPQTSLPLSPEPATPHQTTSVTPSRPSHALGDCTAWTATEDYGSVDGRQDGPQDLKLVSIQHQLEANRSSLAIVDLTEGIVMPLLGDSKAGKTAVKAGLLGQKLANRKVEDNCYDSESGQLISQGTKTVVDYVDPSLRTVAPIGIDSDSETILPRLDVLQDGVSLLDLPGRGDTRGRSLDVANLIIILQTLLSIKQCIPIFVINVQLFSNKSFLFEQLQLLQRLFPNLEQVKKSLVFVYNKLAPADTASDIIHKLAQGHRQVLIKQNPALQGCLNLMLEQLKEFTGRVLFRPLANNTAALREVLLSRHPLSPSTAVYGLPVTPMELHEISDALKTEAHVLTRLMDNRAYADAQEGFATIKSLVAELKDDTLTEVYKQLQNGLRRRVVARLDSAATCLQDCDFVTLADDLVELRQALALHPHIAPPLDQPLDESIEAISDAIQQMNEATFKGIVSSPVPLPTSGVEAMKILQGISSSLCSECSHPDRFSEASALLQGRYQDAQRTFTAALANLAIDLNRGFVNYSDVVVSLADALETLEAAKPYSVFEELTVCATGFQAAQAQLDAALEGIKSQATDCIEHLRRDVELSNSDLAQLSAALGLTRVACGHSRLCIRLGVRQGLHGQLTTLLQGAVEAAVCAPVAGASIGRDFATCAQLLALLSRLHATPEVVSLVERSFAQSLAQVGSAVNEAQVQAIKMVEDMVSAEVAQTNSVTRLVVCLQHLKSAEHVDVYIQCFQGSDQPSDLSKDVFNLCCSKLQSKVTSHYDRLLAVVGSNASFQEDIRELTKLSGLRSYFDFEGSSLLTALEAELQQCQQVDGATATPLEHSQAAYRLGQLDRLLQEVANCPLLDTVQPAPWSVMRQQCQMLSDILVRHGIERCQQLRDRAVGSSQASDFEGAGSSLIELQSMSQSCCHLREAQEIFQLAVEKIRLRVRAAWQEAIQSQAREDILHAQDIRRQLEAGAELLQPFLPEIVDFVSELDREYLARLGQFGSTVSDCLDDENYDGLYDLMQGLGDDNDANTARGTAQRKINGHVKAKLKAMKGLVSVSLSGIEADLDRLRNATVALNTALDLVRSFQPLVPTLPQLVDFKAFLADTVVKTYKGLLARLRQLLSMDRFVLANQLYGSFAHSPVWCSPEFRSATVDEDNVTQDLDNLPNTVSSKVTALQEEYKASDLINLLRELDCAYQGGAFLTQVNFLSIKDSVRASILARLSADVEAARQIVFQNLDAAKARWKRLKHMAKQLQQGGFILFDGAADICEDLSVLENDILAKEAQSTRYHFNVQSSVEILSEVRSCLHVTVITNAAIVLKAAAERVVSETMALAFDQATNTALPMPIIEEVYHMATLTQTLRDEPDPLKRFNMLLDNSKLSKLSVAATEALFSAVTAGLQHVCESQSQLDLDHARQLSQRMLQALSTPTLEQWQPVLKVRDELVITLSRIDSLASSLSFGQHPADKMQLMARDLNVSAVVDRFNTLGRAAHQSSLAMSPSPQQTALIRSWQQLTSHWTGQFELALPRLTADLAALDANKVLHIMNPVVLLGVETLTDFNANVTALEQCKQALSTFRANLTPRVTNLLRMGHEDWRTLKTIIHFANTCDRTSGESWRMDFAGVLNEVVDGLLAELNRRFLAESPPSTTTLSNHLCRLQAYATECNLAGVADRVKVLLTAHLANTAQHDIDTLELASVLQELGEYGGQVVRDYPAFEQARLQQRRDATRSMTIEQALAELERAPKGAMTKAQIDILRKGYTEYQVEFERCLARPNADDLALVEAAKRQCRRLGRGAKVDFAKFRQQLPSILATLTATWTIQSRKKHAHSQDKGIYKEAHTLQVLAIFILGGLHLDSSVNMFDKLINAFSRMTGLRDCRMNGIFIEMLTGNGKSILLGFTSLLFALLDCEVSCACYSSHLSGRDYADFEPLFKLFGVTDLIQYSTISDLAEKHINRHGDIRKAVDKLLRGQSIRAGSSLSTRLKILLVDEVDVLNSEHFLSGSQRPLLSFKDPAATALLKHVWSLPNHAPSSRQAQALVQQLEQHESYLTLVQKFPLLEAVLKSQLAGIYSDKQTYNSPEYLVRNGTVQYKSLDEWKSGLHYGYKTQFAYLHEAAKQDSLITPAIADQHLFVKVNCGSFSYARVIESFNFIFGVTGTLSQLTSSQETLLTQRFRVSDFRYLPSMYGATKRMIANFMLCENADRHRQALVDEVSEVLQQNRPVIVFLPEDSDIQALRQSDAFQAKLSGYDILELTEATAADDVKYTVQQATRAGRLLLATRVFGRGSDFSVLDRTVLANGGVHVIQAFLSVEEAEEVQIKGRTARESNCGTYRLIVNKAHLNAILPDLDLSKVAAGVYEDLLPELQEARTAQFNKALNELEKSLKDCEVLHDQSERFTSDLLDGHTDLALRQLLELNG